MQNSARILIVDDDEGDVHLAMKAMQTAQLDRETLALGDGKEALDYLYRRGAYNDRPPAQPAVVLLDLKMPRVDGFEVLAQIKGDAAMRVIPIVVLTSSSHDRDLQRAYDLGANGYVVKAIGFAEYTSALNTLLRFWTGVNDAPPACIGRAPR